MRQRLLVSLLALALGLFPTVTRTVLADEPSDLGSGVTGGVNLRKASAINEGYFYSRYSFSALVMAAGMGLPLDIPMDMMQNMVMGAIQMVNQGPEDGEHVMVPGNMPPLVAVYASGDPKLINPMGQPSDLSAFRWDSAKMDTMITPGAQAQTIIKLAEWAKMFHTSRFGQPTDAAGTSCQFPDKSRS